jgi:hypothetical protein
MGKKSISLMLALKGLSDLTKLNGFNASPQTDRLGCPHEAHCLRVHNCDIAWGQTISVKNESKFLAYKLFIFGCGESLKDLTKSIPNFGHFARGKVSKMN